MIWILLVGVLLVLIIWCFYYFIILPHKYWKQRGVSTGKQNYIFGDLNGFIFQKHSFHEMIKYVYEKCPDQRYSGMYEIKTPALVLRDPELINEVLVKHFDHFTDRFDLFPEKYNPLWSTSVLNLKGNKWRDMRSILTPAFTGSKLKGMFTLMTTCADQFTNHYSKNKDVVTVDLKDCFTRLTNDVIASCAFGVECNSFENRDNEFYKMGKKLTDPSGHFNGLKFISFVAWPKLPIFLGIPFFNDISARFFTKIVANTMDLREINNIYRPDMISLLMGVKDEISDTDIVAQALIFFFGGFESVANALLFTTYELAVNPDVQERLWKEISHSQSFKEGKLSYNELNQMKYLDCVVTETLRKYPAFGGMDRKCLKTYTIEPVKDDEKPVVIKPGDKVTIPIYGIQHDPKYYEDPQRYNPDRFNEENKKKLTPHTFLAFGSGPRNCLGSRFTMVEIKTVLYHLLVKFELVVSENTPIPITLSKAGFNITVLGKVYIDFVPRKQ